MESQNKELEKKLEQYYKQKNTVRLAYESDYITDEKLLEKCLNYLIDLDASVTVAGIGGNKETSDRLKKKCVNYLIERESTASAVHIGDTGSKEIRLYTKNKLAEAGYNFASNLL